LPGHAIAIAAIRRRHAADVARRRLAALVGRPLRRRWLVLMLAGWLVITRHHIAATEYGHRHYRLKVVNTITITNTLTLITLRHFANTR